MSMLFQLSAHHSYSHYKLRPNSGPEHIRKQLHYCNYILQSKQNNREDPFSSDITFFFLLYYDNSPVLKDEVNAVVAVLVIDVLCVVELVISVTVVELEICAPVTCDVVPELPVATLVLELDATVTIP